MRKLLVLAFAAMLIAPAFAALTADVNVGGTVDPYSEIVAGAATANHSSNSGTEGTLLSATNRPTYSPAYLTSGTATFSVSTNHLVTLTVSLTGAIFAVGGDWTSDANWTGDDKIISSADNETGAPHVVDWSAQPDFDVDDGATDGTITVTITG